MDTRNVAFKGYSYLNQSMEGKQDMALSLKNSLTGYWIQACILSILMRFPLQMCSWDHNTRAPPEYLLSYTHVHSLASHFSLLLPPQLLDPSYFHFHAKPWWLALAPVYLMGKLYKRSSRRETSPKWAWSTIVCKSQGFMHQTMPHKSCGSNTVSCILCEQHKWAASGVSTPFSLV